MMQAFIEAVASGVAAPLIKIRPLDRTLEQRATNVLAFFCRPGTSNGLTKATNEHLRGSALGFQTSTNDVTRSLRESGAFGP